MGGYNKSIKPWRPKRTYKDVIHEYGNEIKSVVCENDQLLVTIQLNYDDIPDEISEEDLLILVEKLNENGGNFSIIPRAKFTSN